MSPVFRICYNFRIVGGQRLSRGRDVGGAVPYKRDRIVFFVLSYNGCNRGLVSSTGELCSPLQICCRNFVRYIYIQFSSYVRGVTLGIMPLVAYTQNTAMHTHVLTQVLYSLFQKLTSVSLSRRACTCPQVSKRFLLIPKITPFVA